jgi:hypothetical protein
MSARRSSSDRSDKPRSGKGAANIVTMANGVRIAKNLGANQVGRRSNPHCMGQFSALGALRNAHIAIAADASHTPPRSSKLSRIAEDPPSVR